VRCDARGIVSGLVKPGDILEAKIAGPEAFQECSIMLPNERLIYSPIVSRGSWRSWCIPTSWVCRNRLHYFREALAHIRAVPDVIFTSGCEICTAFQTGVGETI
jgi:hypothetical protein